MKDPLAAAASVEPWAVGKVQVIVSSSRVVVTMTALGNDLQMPVLQPTHLQRAKRRLPLSTSVDAIEDSIDAAPDSSVAAS